MKGVVNVSHAHYESMNADVPHHSFRSTEGAPLFISNDHPHQSSEHAQYVNSQVQEYHHCPQYTQPIATNQMNSSQTHSKVTLCTQTHSQLPIPEQSNYLTPCVPFIQTHLETTQTPQSYQNTSIQPAQTHTQTIQPQTHTQTIQSQTHSRVQTTDSFSSHSPAIQISDVSLTTSKPKVTWKSHDSNSEINISKDPLTELQTVVSVASSSAFTDQVNHFVKNHSDVFEKLFSHFEDKRSSCTSPVDLTTSCNVDNGIHGLSEAIEFHMGVDPSVRRQKFFEYISHGDIVRGIVMSNRAHYGITTIVTSLVQNQKIREITDLQIKGVIVLENLSEKEEDIKEVLDELQIDDVIQAVVIGIDMEKQVLDLSIKHKPDTHKHLQLGYVEEESLEEKSTPRDNDYIESLTKSTGFKNPRCTENLKTILGIPPGACSSILKPILMKDIPKSEYYDSLRINQRIKWSMEVTAEGVKYFKRNAKSTALKHFHYALEIDNMNVEALVARGALFANEGMYSESIRDFEKALTINHNHQNAKTYLIETYTAYGQKLESERDLKKALRCYREALADDPSTQPAKTRAEYIISVLEKKTAERRERERRKEEEEARLKKLRKIIEKERRREDKLRQGKSEKKEKTEKRKKKGKSKSRKYSSSSHDNKSKRKRARADYSSDESTDTKSNQSCDSSHDSMSPDTNRSHNKRLSK